MNDIIAPTISEQDNERINECVRNVLITYFKDMDTHIAGDLYQLVLSEVEKPLFETVMQHTNNNQSKAAAILGINRGTLRKKLKQYHIE